jgi:hypothetical protein
VLTLRAQVLRASRRYTASVFHIAHETRGPRQLTTSATRCENILGILKQSINVTGTDTKMNSNGLKSNVASVRVHVSSPVKD